MSFLLAVESSTKHLSVALFEEGRLLEEIVAVSDGTVSQGRTHSEKLLPLIDQILNARQFKIADIRSFAVAVGPGSFTSLRVGMATVMGLACGTGSAIYPVSSLKAMALGVAGDGVLIAPVIKGGRGRVYGAVYQRKGRTVKQRIKQATYEPEGFLAKTRKLKQKIFFVGPGFEILGVRSGPKNIYLDYVFPRASQVGFLAINEKIKPIRPEGLRIRYLQEPDLGGKIQGVKP